MLRPCKYTASCSFPSSLVVHQSQFASEKPLSLALDKIQIFPFPSQWATSALHQSHKQSTKKDHWDLNRHWFVIDRSFCRVFGTKGARNKGHASSNASNDASNFKPMLQARSTQRPTRGNLSAFRFFRLDQKPAWAMRCRSPKFLPCFPHSRYPRCLWLA